jgi:hypothetical protein
MRDRFCRRSLEISIPPILLNRPACLASIGPDGATTYLPAGSVFPSGVTCSRARRVEKARRDSGISAATGTVPGLRPRATSCSFLCIADATFTWRYRSRASGAEAVRKMFPRCLLNASNLARSSWPAGVSPGDIRPV